MRQRRCKICNEIKSLDLFSCETGWTCAVCTNIKQQQKRLKNPEKYKKERRKYVKNYPIKSLLRNAKTRAKKKNLLFMLEKEDIIIPKFCPVLGILDRIDAKLEYVKGNVKVISWRANNLKRDATLEELKKIVNYYEAKKAIEKFDLKVEND